jgi:energy-coupling factor transporter ATP-binding protein EcfA2/FtsZ-binding cell division protein ZapB
MELVYLWVEEYKNIRNQGFNFSPRFECEFFPEYEDGKLEIVPKDYMSIFPDNINITAIVGENGTGKSRVIKLLYGLYTNQLEKNVNCFAIFYDYEQEQYFYLGDKKKFHCLEAYNELKDTAFVLFDYSLTYQPEFNYEQHNLIYPKKQISSVKGAISLTKELIRNQKNILLNYFELKKHNQFDKFKDFFIADRIVIEFDNTRFQNAIDYKKGLLDDKKQEVIEIIPSIQIGQTLADFIEKLKEIQNILNKQDSFEKKEETNFDNPFFQDWFQWCEQMEKDNQEKNFWDESFVNKKIWDEFIKNKTITPQRIFKEIVENGEKYVPSYEILSDEVKNLNKDLIDIILSSFGQEYFTIKLIDKNQKILNDLSFGEQQLIFILNQLFALRYEEFLDEETSQREEIKNFIVLLDEIDIGFHPNWQKRAIQYVCDFLRLIPEKKFHLVFTTHSPFLISDLPNKNIIFLKKDENSNCKNVSKNIELKTFGANIHTLLSNGFFMSNGLMGKFAKSKINEVINNLHNKQNSLSQKQIRSIIDTIGEPFLQIKLEQMYKEKFGLDDEIEELQKQQESINQKIEQLKKQKSENAES